MAVNRRSTLLLLCFFLGWFGVHRFATGKTKTAAFQLLTLGGAGLWTLIDFIYIACGAFRGKDGQPIRQW